jgi:hypothetical protein
MGAGFEAAILSTGNIASLASADGLLGIKMLDKMLEGQVQAAASLISDIQSLPPPAGAGDVGGLLDIKG